MKYLLCTKVRERRVGDVMGVWVANLMNGGASRILKRALKWKDTLEGSFEGSTLSPYETITSLSRTILFLPYGGGFLVTPLDNSTCRTGRCKPAEIWS